MPALREVCNAFAGTLRGGPDLCPEGLFASDIDRTLLGLKIHANTVSHARLMALEESFPHTLDAMGHQDFNAASRAWLDAGHGRAAALTLIGADFPDWLAQQNAFRVFAALARFEWLWLEAYHAAEAAPLSPEVMQKMPPPAILECVAAPHPSARISSADWRISALCDFPFATNYVALTRPDAEVRVYPATADMAHLLALFDGISTIQQILETFWGDRPNEDAVAGINQLVAIGALTSENAPC